MRYTEVRPAAYNAKARLEDMDEDGIDLAVLHPTSMPHTSGTRRAEAHHDQSRARLDLFTTSVLVHRGSRREHLGIAEAHLSSVRTIASLSRIAIKRATRGDISTLASASMR
jgi:hypothetical protein